MENIRENKGITLIALVVTVIVLIILASVATVSGVQTLKSARLTKFTAEMKLMQVETNELYDKQKYEEGKEITSNSEIKKQADKVFRTEESGITSYEGYRYFDKDTLEKLGIDNVEGEFFINVKTRMVVSFKGIEYEGKIYYTLEQLPNSLYNVDYKPERAEGLEIGSTVSYTPSGKYENWKAKYSGSDEDVILNSAEADWKISEWRVLDIENEKVTLVPTAPTTETVNLGNAQGYNNGVKLLNDACSSLYGNSAKGITARNMSIEDIEKYMTEEFLEEAHGCVCDGLKYGEQVPNAYTADNSEYPVIYAKENLSVINGGEAKTDGLGMSEQLEFIEPTENGAKEGKITTATSIQPYKTHWIEHRQYKQTDFKTAENGTKYYDLIMPKGSNTDYWLASRNIEKYNGAMEYCNFDIRVMNNGVSNRGTMFSSPGYFYRYSRAPLFPVVSLNFNQITGNETDGFRVKLN